MVMQKRVEVFGDSLLKGIQLSPKLLRYHVDNKIGIEEIEKRHSLKISNFSKFGCTVTKGLSLIKKRLQSDEPSPDFILMDFGGNDCDYNWKEVSEHPDEEHLPKTPLEYFVNTYNEIITLLKEKGIQPILTTLPPLDAQRFFSWFCKELNKENVLKWLGDIQLIYRWQELYSRKVESLATETKTPLIDLRGGFLKHRRLDLLLCEDGTHPNTDGQKVMTQTFLDFIKSAKSATIDKIF